MSLPCRGSRSGLCPSCPHPSVLVARPTPGILWGSAQAAFKEPRGCHSQSWEVEGIRSGEHSKPQLRRSREEGKVFCCCQLVGAAEKARET